MHTTPHDSGVIVVTGCGGGAGASTLVAGLAAACARSGRRVAVLDLDRYGGGLDVVFGIEQQDGVRWAQVAGSQGQLDGPALISALPSAGDCVVLSYGREGTAVPEQVRAASIEALGGVCDVLLVDAPRGCDPSGLPARSIFVVVADGSVREELQRGAVVRSLRSDGRDPVVVVRDASERFADDLADGLSVRVIAHVASEQRVENDLSRGEVPGSRGELARVCERLVDALVAREAAAA